MKPPYTFLLLSCLLHLYSFSGRIEAQNLPRGDTSPKEFIFHTIDTDNGLPENQVRYIKQLKDHRMLIVTVGTITLYDGGSFRSLHSLPRNYMSVVPPYTNCSEQIQNEVWIRNGDKLCILDLETEQLRDHPEAYVTQLTGLKEKIKDVFPDNAGCLWIYTQSDKLYRYCEKEKRLSPVPHRFSSTAFEAITLSEHTYLLLRDGTCVCLGKKDLKPVSDFLLAEKKLATPGSIARGHVPSAAGSAGATKTLKGPDILCTTTPLPARAGSSIRDRTASRRSPACTTGRSP